LGRKDAGFPDFGREQLVNKEAHFVKEDQLVHYKLVALHEGIDMRLDIKLGESNVLRNPPESYEMMAGYFGEA
jgi:hypothetical protein